MLRTKTLSLPLVTALIAGSALTAQAQLIFELSSDITYRQNPKSMRFMGGSFDVNLRDGSAATIPFCSYASYQPPGIFNNACSPGTTGLVSAGLVEGVQRNQPYILVNGIVPAFAIAPRLPESVRLYAAPASELPRPSAGFKDDSYSLFYNLTTTDIREYIITHYYKYTGYTARQREKFESQIVSGSYYYQFPSLADPERLVPVSAVIYPMIEGRQERNNVEAGFAYSQVNGNDYTKKGFVELSYLRPNKFKWIGVTPSNVFAAVDATTFAIKVMKNPSKANSGIVETYQGLPVSIFPPYQNGGEPSVLLTNPYVGSFTTPPIFQSGTSGVAQVQFKRNFKTGGVSYDFSTRRFQIPVVVVDRYSEYQELNFVNAAPDTTILRDPDGDGFNNLNEWILESDPTDTASIPIAPVPQLVTTLDIPGEVFQPEYFGFDVLKKLGTVPRVKYTLQISRNNGKTWKRFRTNPDWSVRNVRRAANGPFPTSVTIQVRSLRFDPDTFEPVQPPGTASDIYRVKVTLAK